jgi:putative SOS response-associated peptidase YedK
MCGRFTLEPTANFYERFQISNRLDSLIPRYNIAPGQMVPVIIAQRPRQLVRMRWGLIPHWTKDQQTAYKMINARVETLKAEGRDKTPYYIHPQSEPFMAFAGLYDVWIHPTGEELYTFTIITTEADPFMARLHNRMPVVLERDLENDWLDPEITSTSDVLGLLERSAGVPLDAYPVSRLVNKPSVDGEELIRPIE